MNFLMNPMLLRMGLLLFAAIGAFGFALLAMRSLRKHLVTEPESLDHAPLTTEGLPVHAYHAVIQQLKQQKHELTTQQLLDRRKAKASDTLSSTILANLSCGVLFVNTNGLVRQANAAARDLLGFASPVGLHYSDLFRTATLRPQSNNPGSGLSAQSTVDLALAPALAGKSPVRGLVMTYFSRDGENHVLEVTASPVLAEDASFMGTTLVVTDRTDIERIRHEQRIHQELSSELTLGLRNSLTTIAEYAQQLAFSHDPERGRQFAEGISEEIAQLDRTIVTAIGSLPRETQMATTSS